MKSSINLYILTPAAITAVAFLSPLCLNAQKFSLKPHVDIGVGSVMSLKSDLQLSTKSSSSTSFGVDFGYTFWKLDGNSLEVNIGLGYSTTGIKLGTEGFDYSYNAPASADEDGNPYVRHYSLSDLEQKFNIDYFNIPLYLSYGYQFNHRIGVHADLGFRFGFKCNAKMNSVSGTTTSYGIYPEYDNLVINAPWLNGFGTTDLADAKKGVVDANGFYTSLLVGAALDVYIDGPVWLNAGVRYDCGFTNCFKHLYKGSTYTAENAPVSYTVAEGQKAKPLTGYLNLSKLSPFSVHIGLTFKF